MDIKISVQSTPNPNALKFILNVPVKNEGKITFKNPQACPNIPLAQELFKIVNVSDIHFFENVITVTQTGDGDWDPLIEQIKSVILANIEKHDASFVVEEEKRKADIKNLDPEISKIEEILDRTVRMYLQSDGGDIQVLKLEGTVLTVNYQGACGSCPSSTAGTLKAIENILKEEYNPDLEVVSLNSGMAHDH